MCNGVIALESSIRVIERVQDLRVWSSGVRELSFDALALNKDWGMCEKGGGGGPSLRIAPGPPHDSSPSFSIKRWDIPL